MIATELALQILLCVSVVKEMKQLYYDTYHTARCEMIDYIKDTSVCSGHKGSCSISEGLLLAPSCVNNISKRDNNIIKEALFEFLNKSDRTI